MANTAQAVLEAAYARSSGNDPGKLASDAEMLAHMNRIFQRTWAMLAKARPDEFVTSVTWTLSGNPASVALPTDVIDVVGILNATGAQVHLIEASERFRLWHMAPCLYRLGMTLTSRQKAGDPTAGDVLTATITDAPTALTLLTTVIDSRWPTRHLQVLIDLVGVYLSAKDSGRSPSDRDAMLGELRQSAAALALDYRLPPSATEWMQASADRGST